MKRPLISTIEAGTFWLSLNSVTLKIIGIATIFLTLNYLSVYEYGLVELVLSVVPLLGLVLLPGLSDVVVADLGVEKERGNAQKMKSVFLSYATLLCLLAVAAWALVFFGSDMVSEWYPGVAGDLLAVASFLFISSPIRILVSVLLSVYLRFFAQALYSFLEEIFRFLLVAYLLVFAEAGAHGVVLAAVLSQFIALALFVPFALRLGREFLQAPGSDPISPLSLFPAHRLWGMASSYLSQFGNNLRLWIIKIVLGTEAVGLFAVAYGLIGHTTSLVPLSRVLAPLLPQYASQPERFRRILIKGFKYQLAGYTVAGLSSAAAVPVLLIVLFPNYVAAIPIFLGMLFALPSLSAAPLLTTVFYAYKEQKSLFWSLVLKTTVTIVSAPLLVFLGIFGAACEFVLTATVFTIDRYRKARSLIELPDVSVSDMVKIDDDDLFITRLFTERLRKFISFAK